jgi:enoyl-CoA hydratase/carnithine racemase
MEESSVDLAFEDGIATLTLNRPDSLNAMSGRMMRSLEQRLDEMGRFPGLRVVIVTGAGRAFSAGGDLKEFEALLSASGTKLIDTLRYNQQILQRVEDVPVPVIGAANGTAIAGGLELLLCCDIILASEGAAIGDGHARYGIVPAGGATTRLHERLSSSRAAQLLYTASTVRADELLAWGLVNEVLPENRLMDRARELAREICRNSPAAVRAIKSLERARNDSARQERLRMEIEAWAMHVSSPDLAEGLKSFGRRERPRYERSIGS